MTTLLIDHTSGRFTYGDHTVQFKPVRWRIFARILRSFPKYVHSDILRDTVDKYRSEAAEPKNLHVHICLMRKALAGLPLKVVNSWGFGYAVEFEPGVNVEERK